MLSTLILNKDETPLIIVSGRRGLELVFAGKALSVEDSTQTMSTPDASYFIPYIVQLTEYVAPTRKSMRVPYSRRGVLRRDKNVCVYCKVRRGDTIDHVVPRAKGGSTSWDNCVAACRPCNKDKADILLSELGWETPTITVPSWYDLLRIMNEGRSRRLTLAA